MSDFTDKIKEKAEALSAAIDNELTVLEGAGGDDVLAEPDDDGDDDTDTARETSES